METKQLSYAIKGGEFGNVSKDSTKKDYSNHIFLKLQAPNGDRATVSLTTKHVRNALSKIGVELPQRSTNTLRDTALLQRALAKVNLVGSINYYPKGHKYTYKNEAGETVEGERITAGYRIDDTLQVEFELSDRFVDMMLEKEVTSYGFGNMDLEAVLEGAGVQMGG